MGLLGRGFAVGLGLEAPLWAIFPLSCTSTTPQHCKRKLGLPPLEAFVVGKLCGVFVSLTQCSVVELRCIFGRSKRCIFMQVWQVVSPSLRFVRTLSGSSGWQHVMQKRAGGSHIMWMRKRAPYH